MARFPCVSSSSRFDLHKFPSVNYSMPILSNTTIFLVSSCVYNLRLNITTICVWKFASGINRSVSCCALKLFYRSIYFKDTRIALGLKKAAHLKRSPDSVILMAQGRANGVGERSGARRKKREKEGRGGREQQRVQVRDSK